MPAPYSFKQIFAADPSNPANVATNGTILLYAPGDAAKTPLAITDLSGSLTLANPVPVNANGFGPAFLAPVDVVAWEGGGFTGTFESFEGMRDEATSARAAADSAAASAAIAATNAAAEVDAQMAGAVADAQSAADSAAASAALVNAPADAAVKTLIESPGSATAAALNATFAPVMPDDINMRTLGAAGSNTVDNTAFESALATAKASKRSTTYATDPLGMITIDIPAGDFQITDIRGLIGAEEMTQKVRGLRLRGAGSDLTQIIFAPSGAGEMGYNKYWQNVAFEGMTFATAVADSTFLTSEAVAGSAPQEYTFTDIKWSGPWKYVLNLVGTNNNSEFRFFGCATSGMAAGGAFLYISAVNTSDQFLNYWFYGFKHWSTSAALVDAARGGHFHFYGLDCSAWGVDLTAPGYILNLRGNTHSHGTQTLTANGMRVEAKNPLAGLLYSEWADGNVTIECDWSSQVSTYTYGDIIYIDLGNVSGPIYNFHDSNLAGGIKIKYGTSAWAKQHRIGVNQTVWQQRLTPSEVVSYDESAVSASGNVIRPSVTFDGCRGNYQSYATGASVWNATIGHGGSGDLVKSTQKRVVQVHSPGGSLTTETAIVNLPVGALITGITSISPATSSGDDLDGGTWKINTTEATPVTVASVSTSGRLAAGYSLHTELPVPYLCDTRERATLSVTAAGVTLKSRLAFVAIEGYW